MLLNDTNDGTDRFNKALENQGLTFQTRMTGNGDFLNPCNLYALITVNLRPSTKDLGYGNYPYIFTNRRTNNSVLSGKAHKSV